MNEIVREYVRKLLLERQALMRAVVLVDGAGDELASLIVQAQADATDSVLDAVGATISQLRGSVCFNPIANTETKP